MGKELIDKYSVLHFGVGATARLLGFGIWTMLAGHVTFEIVENTPAGMKFINENFRTWWPGGKNYSDSMYNIVGDNMSAILGWFAARRFLR